MTNICEALNRPMREVHPEIAAAMAAKADLLVSGVAVDEHARVAIENEASKLYEASPRAADKRAAETVCPAHVQTADKVPERQLVAPKQVVSVARVYKGPDNNSRETFDAGCDHFR